MSMKGTLKRKAVHTQINLHRKIISNKHPLYKLFNGYSFYNNILGTIVFILRQDLTIGTGVSIKWSLTVTPIFSPKIYTLALIRTRI